MSVVFTVSKAPNAYGVTMDWEITRGGMNTTDTTLMMQFAQQVTKRAQSKMHDTASFNSDISQATKLENYKSIIEGVIRTEVSTVRSGLLGSKWATVVISNGEND
jgi:hypothetical protein